MSIVPLSSLSPSQSAALVELTFEAAAEHWPAWLPTLADARAELAEAEPKHARVVLEADHPTGWVAIEHAWGRVWELHPLIVARAHQRRGLGRRLVREAEQFARSQGALTMILGTSDSTRATSFANIDLYTDTASHIAAAHVVRPHPLAFWQRVGYTVVGVVPDAEGAGEPSIQLARRL